MAGSPDYKVYMGKAYIGCFKDLAHAYIFCEAMQQGDHLIDSIEVRDGHRVKNMIRRYPKLTKIAVGEEGHWARGDTALESNEALGINENGDSVGTS